MLLLLLGCLAHYPLVGPNAPASTTPVATAQELPPITFSPLEERLEIIFSVSTDADQRDRLADLRELLHAMRARDPVAQRRVYDYAEAVLKIESRDLPQALPVEEGIEPLVVPIEERPLQESSIGPTVPPVGPVTPPPTDPNSPVVPGPAALLTTSPLPVVPVPPAGPTPADLLATARASFAAGNYLGAVETLAPLTSTEAATLRKETVDAWARTEREAAGAAFITARALPAGADRNAALVAARDRLVAINTRFPDNNFAAAIAENIAKVNVELAP